ncbi:Acetyltransferase (GNAT) domain-containing protein [Paenibacillus polysaccharolyticus]|uniref:Acetyltransferase (GNAT) domain-containing protein n=1 Tax=Paenibacillus polysaccharolyticus TaxID=582692 RepID=A0A1G5JH79_9BACL|nr:GNAT family N-acetyltransferase [Paenibacillus polysaccharolyticus]SCY87260.1 Acetyltransferase (GNAT) domain-containing protein [Paenibacillus polysaccharolyticus]
MEVQILKKQISVEDYMNLREIVGWGNPENIEAIERGLKNTLYSICIEVEEQTIGYGRIVGDGGFTFYIQDIIVLPSYQRLGLGNKIMTELMEYITSTYPPGSSVGLMSAKGKEDFYKKFGFVERPNEGYGAGMIQYLTKP